MKIMMLEMIKTPFLAAKGEIRDVNSEVAIDLEKHGMATLLIDEGEEPAVTDEEITEFNRRSRRSRSAK